MQKILALVILGFLSCGINLFGEEPAPDPAFIDYPGLSQEDYTSLDKNGILVTSETSRQIFSAYIYKGKPLFITSDSLLNAYHVLYAESVKKMEKANSKKLEAILNNLMGNLYEIAHEDDCKDQIYTQAIKRAKLILGIAKHLLDENFHFQDPELDKLLNEQVKLIIAAEGSGKPEWLGKPDTGFMAIDYNRYKPRGFYVDTRTLQRYFRALSWLQSIPFRPKFDEELLTAHILSDALGDRRITRVNDDATAYFNAYREFIGSQDDIDLLTAKMTIGLYSGSLEKNRESIAEYVRQTGHKSMINDQQALTPDDVTIRIISQYRTPSALLFAKTTNPHEFDRAFPSPMEMCVALGGKNVRTLLPEKVIKTIDQSQQYFVGDSLYFLYLDALRTLLAVPEPDAPDFMKKPSWEIKSCNTVLAGWIQLSHTWVLQSKQNVMWLCGHDKPLAGFVEPNPDFYSKMAELCTRTSSVLKATGAFNPDYDDLIEQLEKLLQVMEKSKNYSEYMEKVDTLFRSGNLSENPVMIIHSLDYNSSFTEIQKKVKQLIADIKDGKNNQSDYTKSIINGGIIDLESRWLSMTLISRRLETLAHKQLRQVDFNKGEEEFIKSYGEAIAKNMFFEGNSFTTPRDDAPKVVDIFTNFNTAEPFQLVGIGRPRRLLVSYPWKGKRILCQGAIMPFYEFFYTSRLTDQEWIIKLDSDTRPAPPQWLKPIIWAQGLDEKKDKAE